MQDRDALTALSPGVPLWLIPPLEVSAWSKRIDWYLGFQIRRALPYRRFDFGPDMRQLIESYEDVIPKIARTDEAPLMVASSQLLPNHQTVVIPVSREKITWAETCHRVWKGLDQPATRVFLPPGLTREQFVKAWPGHEAHDSVEIVSTEPSLASR
jgi:hypothetical protein